MSHDITSAHIMVDGNGALKILPFGIAAFASSTTTAGARAPIGTMNHMAREQVSGESTDARRDIFAVGAVFYELPSGRPAFAGDLASLESFMHHDPESLEALCPGVDPDIVGIVRQCLEKDDPSRQYPSLDAVRNDLRRALDRCAALDEDFVSEIDAAEQPLRFGAEPIRGPEPTRRVLDREELACRRHRQIQLHLQHAEQALSAGDFDAGIDACEEVLLLDSENAGARSDGSRQNSAGPASDRGLAGRGRDRNPARAC